MRKSFILCWLVLLLLMNISSVYGQFAGGDGSEANPYQVATAEQLNNVRNYLTSWFIQTADINLGVEPFNQGEGWEPLGYDDNPFTGGYNGNGFKILNLYINRPTQNAIGLFHLSADTESISNVILIDVNVTGYDYVGALVGYFVRNQLLYNCHASGVVTGNEFVGGLLGLADNHPGTNDNMAIYNCSFQGEVNGDIKVGGLVGHLCRTRCHESYSRGIVNGTTYVGGLLGQYHMAYVSNCFSATNIGGILGHDEGGSIVGSYWDSEIVSGTYALGGNPRTTDQMTHPYDSNTYVGWNFTDIWIADSLYLYNNGYPYLYKPNPYAFFASETKGFLPFSTSFLIIPEPPDSTSICWDFENDGIIDSYELSPSYTYTQPGKYSVKVMISTVADIDSVMYLDYITVLDQIYEIDLISNEHVNFGSVYIQEQSDYRVIKFQNTGTMSLDISDIHFISTPLHFVFAYPIRDTTLAPTEIDSILVRFTPQTVGNVSDTLFIENNSTNLPVVSVGLSGNGLHVLPKPPQNLCISNSGNDIYLNWDPVTQNLHDQEIEPDYYFIYISSNPYAPYTLMTLTPNLYYTHSYIGLGSDRMFYRVSAVKFYRNDLSHEELEALLRRCIYPGMTEADVRAFVNEVY